MVPYLGLQVAVRDVVLVQHLDPVDNLVEELAGLHLGHISVRHDVVEHLAALGVLHHEVDGVWRVENLVELDDVAVPRLLQDLDLAIHAPHVGLLLDAALL